MLDAIDRVMNWVSADRSTTGDAHVVVTDPSIDDAWLIVHLVGALILRLVGLVGQRRPEGGLRDTSIRGAAWLVRDRLDRPLLGVMNRQG